MTTVLYFRYIQHCPWLVHLADKLLSNDPVTAQLLAPGGNPFALLQRGGEVGEAAPLLRFVRAELYEVMLQHVYTLSWKLF